MDIDALIRQWDQRQDCTVWPQSDRRSAVICFRYGGSVRVDDSGQVRPVSESGLHWHLVSEVESWLDARRSQQG
jgi:hypothetical protein